jgi:hypothetical protein
MPTQILSLFTKGADMSIRTRNEAYLRKAAAGLRPLLRGRYFAALIIAGLISCLLLGTPCSIAADNPQLAQSLRDAGFTDLITNKLPPDQPGGMRNLRIIRHSVEAGRIRWGLATGSGTFRGTYDFVIKPDGTVVVGRGHTVLSPDGAPVAFAGQFRFDRKTGEIVAIVNDSGHYQTPSNRGLTEAAKKYLEKLGVDLSKAQVIDASGPQTSSQQPGNQQTKPGDQKKAADEQKPTRDDEIGRWEDDGGRPAKDGPPAREGTGAGKDQQGADNGRPQGGPEDSGRQSAQRDNSRDDGGGGAQNDSTREIPPEDQPRQAAQSDATREIPRDDEGGQPPQNDQTREIARDDQGAQPPQNDQTREIPRDDQGRQPPQNDQTREMPREGEPQPGVRTAELEPPPAQDRPRPVPPEGISSFAEPTLTENMIQGAKEGLLVGLPLAFINCAVRPDATFNGCVAETLKTVPVAALAGAMLTVPGGAVLVNGVGAAALVKDLYDVASEYNEMNKAQEEADKKEDEAIRNADLKTFGDFLKNRCDFSGALQLANRLKLTKGVGLPGKLSPQSLQALLRGIQAQQVVEGLMAKAANQTGSSEQATLNQALKAANGIPCLEKKVRDAINANPIVKVEKDPKTPPPPATPTPNCPTLTPPDPTSGPTSTDHPLTEDVNADFSPPPCPGNPTQQASAADPNSSNAPLGDDNSNPKLDDNFPPIWEPPLTDSKRSGKCLEEAAAEQDAADALRELLKKPKTQTTPAAITAARASWKKAHDDLDDCANGRNAQKVADASPGNQQQGRTPAPKPIPEGHVSPNGTVTPTNSKPIEEGHKPAVERQNPIQEERKPIAERQKPTVKQADPVRPTLPPTKEDVSNKAADLVKKSPSPAPSTVPQSDFLRTQPPLLAERPNSTVMPPAPIGPVGPPPSRPNNAGRTVASLPNPAQSTPGQPVDPHRASDAIIHDPPDSFAPTAAAPTQNDVRTDALRRANDALKAARPATPQGPRPTQSLAQIQRAKKNALAQADTRRPQRVPSTQADVRAKALAEANKAVTARRPGTQLGSRTNPSALQLQQRQRNALAHAKPPQPPRRGAQSSHTAARGPSYKVPQVHSSRQAHNVQPRRQSSFQPRAAQHHAPVYRAQPRAQARYSQPRQQRRYAAPRQQMHYSAPRQQRYAAPRQQMRYSAPRPPARSFAPRVAYAGRRR